MQLDCGYDDVLFVLSLLSISCAHNHETKTILEPMSVLEETIQAECFICMVSMPRWMVVGIPPSLLNSMKLLDLLINTYCVQSIFIRMTALKFGHKCKI